jgi:hypothetical protein
VPLSVVNAKYEFVTNLTGTSGTVSDEDVLNEETFYFGFMDRFLKQLELGICSFPLFGNF